MSLTNEFIIAEEVVNGKRKNKISTEKQKRNQCAARLWITYLKKRELNEQMWKTLFFRKSIDFKGLLKKAPFGAVLLYEELTFASNRITI